MADAAVKLETRALSVFYGAFEAVKKVDIAFPSCAITAIIGPSGCGKSTLLRAVNGLIPHMYRGEYSGTVTVAGREVAKTEMRDLAQTVGFNLPVASVPGFLWPIGIFNLTITLYTVPLAFSVRNALATRYRLPTKAWT